MQLHLNVPFLLAVLFFGLGSGLLALFFAFKIRRKK